MSGYTNARKITCTEDESRRLPNGYTWRAAYARKTGAPVPSEWSVRSDAGALSTRFDACDSLTDARRLARRLIREGRTTWAEVFRWCENGTGIRSVFWCSYERELIVE